MFLGMMLFFDAALLALGNVGTPSRQPVLALTFHPSAPDVVPLRPHTHHWAPENILLLCSQTKTAWNDMFSRWHSARLFQIPVHWDDRRDLWILESLWVGLSAEQDLRVPLTSLRSSDFFPVVLTFLRQLPFVGTFLSLPYIRPVGNSSTRRTSQ